MRQTGVTTGVMTGVMTGLVTGLVTGGTPPCTHADLGAASVLVKVTGVIVTARVCLRVAMGSLT